MVTAFSNKISFYILRIGITIFPNGFIENSLFHSADTFRDVLLNVAVPKPQHSPTHRPEFSGHFCISLHIPPDLGIPIVAISIYRFFAVKIPPVPERRIAEYCYLMLGNHDIRFSRKTLVVLPVSDTFRPQSLAKLNLNRRVIGSDVLHVLFPLFWGQIIHSECSHTKQAQVLRPFQELQKIDRRERFFRFHIHP